MFAPLAALTSPNVQKVLLAVLILNQPLRISEHFFFREDAEVLGSIAGFDISLGTIALAALCLGLLLTSGAPGGARPHRRDLIGLAVVLVFLFDAVSLLVADDLSLGLFEVWAMLESMVLYFYVAAVVTSRQDTLFIMRLLMAGVIVEDFMMLAQATGLIGSIQAFGLKAAFEGDRVSGTFGSPNSAGCYLSLMMALALGILVAHAPRGDKLLASAALALSTAPLIYASSRAGWVSFLVSLVTAGFLGRRRVAWKPAAAALVVVVILSIPFAGAVRERLTSDDNGAAESRIPLNRIAGLMIQDHLLLGVGANNFAVAMQPYVTKGFLGEFLYTVHNRYLLVWAETGTGGLVAFLLLMLAILSRAWRCCRSSDRFVAGLSLGIAAATTGLAADMLFDLAREGPTIRALWLFGALITALSRMRADGNPAAERVPVV